MNKLLKDVEIFHNTYNLPVLTKPTVPSLARRELRYSLIDEEFDELLEAIENKDMTEIADAIVDLLYVTNGAILEFGLQNAEADTFVSDIVDTPMELGVFPARPTIEIIDQYQLDTYLLSCSVDDIEDTMLHTCDSVTKHDKNALEKVSYQLYDFIETLLIVACCFGLRDCLVELHDEVQRSNLSKLGEDGKPIYNEMGKVVKGPNFFKPNLKAIIEKHQNSVTVG